MLANDMKEIFAMLREERLNTARRCAEIAEKNLYDGRRDVVVTLDDIRREFELDK